MGTRSRVALALAVVLLGVTTAVLVAHSRHQHPVTRKRVSQEQADALARQACQLTSRMLGEIDDNGATRTVLELSARARDAAGEAEYGSARWVVLAGAVQALDKALRTDDARLAQTGIQEIGPACADAGVTVRQP